MRTVLVTGGTTRLGKAIADALAQLGWRVLRTSHRPEAHADLGADFSREGAAQALWAELSRRALLPLDALVNNAAVYVAAPETVRRVNLLAPQALARLMAAQDLTPPPAVVNILDAALLGEATPPCASAPYAETKRELAAWTRTAAKTFAGRLRLNAVAPGAVLAPVGIREKAPHMPLGRPTCDDVARAVAFLLDARATTGAIIPVDGGISL